MTEEIEKKLNIIIEYMTSYALASNSIMQMIEEHKVNPKTSDRTAAGLAIALEGIASTRNTFYVVLRLFDQESTKKFCKICKFWKERCLCSNVKWWEND